MTNLKEVVGISLESRRVHQVDKSEKRQVNNSAHLWIKTIDKLVFLNETYFVAKQNSLTATCILVFTPFCSTVYIHVYQRKTISATRNSIFELLFSIFALLVLFLYIPCASTSDKCKKHVINSIP